VIYQLEAYVPNYIDCHDLLPFLWEIQILKHESYQRKHKGEKTSENIPTALQIIYLMIKNPEKINRTEKQKNYSVNNNISD
jgi:hypothetical protein